MTWCGWRLAMRYNGWSQAEIGTGARSDVAGEDERVEDFATLREGRPASEYSRAPVCKQRRAPAPEIIVEEEQGHVAPHDLATMSQITTPQQLSDWVEALLSQVETRLNERNKQVEIRSMCVADAVNEMADRIDALESSIQGMPRTNAELVHGTETNASVPDTSAAKESS